METKRYRLKDRTNTNRFRAGVFGGDSFLDLFPDLMSDEGVDLYRHTNEFDEEGYYMVKNGRPVDGVADFDDSTCFFSAEEMVFLEPVGS